jgi:pilus assembly protein Flp/PilA
MPFLSGISWPHSRKSLAFATWRALLHDETGQDLIEYALIGALIALGSVASTRALATTITVALEHVRTSLNQAI